MFGLLKGMAVTIRQLPKKKVTLMYPEQEISYPERFRGVHRFIPELCTVCNQCARICPTDCISLSGSRDEKRKLRIETYDINYDICILCNLCTEVCPTEAILMSDKFELASYNRDDFYLDMHWLYHNELEYERLHPDRAIPQTENQKEYERKRSEKPASEA
ncbi:NADH-quinone oxidoreductase subunit I [Alicyclobacillaceae bacterium I2511]|nr:NADH-quinone oxidoreductase subunit I [Alicyclobacillaceae bacterium I2511]